MSNVYVELFHLNSRLEVFSWVDDTVK